MKRKPLYFLIVLFIAISGPIPLIAQQKADSSSARFLIIGDWGGFASKNQKAVAAAMGKEAQINHDQFVITVGDNYHGKGIASATDPRWKTEYEEIYSAISLQIPWYPTLGNHDYEGSPQAELDYSKYSKRWKFHHRYYAQEKKIDDSTKILIVHLDTSPFVTEYQQHDDQYHVKSQNTADQLHWLDSLLAATKDRWVIVVGHHPIYSAAPKHGDTPEMQSEVLPILEEHHVPVYVCGHDHVMQQLKDNGMNFFICGGGAEHRDVNERPDVIYGKGSMGFLSVTAYRDSLNFKMLDENNVLLHQATISK